MRRRTFLAGAIGAGVGAIAADSGRRGGAAALVMRPAAAQEPSFGFEHVRELARRLAEEEFQDITGGLPESLRAIGYDEYRRIRYRPEQALWLRDREVPFRVEFFHLGFHYQRPVRVNVVEEGLVLEVRYNRELFDYGTNGFAADDLPEGLGFAGFRLRHPLDRHDVYDEVAAFLGASYFRILGRGQHYGISARGLAVDTALPSGEEFPFFREFWLEKPAPGAKSMTFYALLDGGGIAGAYRFTLDPGVTTRLDVEATLYPRRAIERLGVAPLTSMFLFGENSPPRFDDFRPEVHDSDGLAMHNGNDEWLWRPLDNRRELRVSSFVDVNPKGFGLFQRDQAFAHYQDLEALYHVRPSYWVEPAGEWGDGVVQLVEIPTEREVNDNVVVYWVPAAPVEPGRPIEVAYRLHALLEAPGRPPLGRTEATRIGPGQTEGSRRFVIDFEGGPLEGLEPDAPVELVVEAARGEIPLRVAQPNPIAGGWRVFFDFVPADDDPADLRCFLQLNGQRLTETWIYLWTAS